MKLYYFNINDTPEVLKSKRNNLVKKHHPDKATEGQKAVKTEIMKRINSEYEFLLKENKRSKIAERAESTQEQKPINKDTIEQAQNIFHALTHLTSIDYLLLIGTIMAITDWKEVSKVYYRMYGISTLIHLKKVLPSKELEKILKVVLNTSS
jgi:hypothetical protein